MLFDILNDYGYICALHDGWAVITYFSKRANDVVKGWVEATGD